MVTAYDFLQVIVNGKVAGQLWRAQPPSLVLPEDVCMGNVAEAHVVLLVSTYGRDNFYVSGTREEMLKGIVGSVTIIGGDGESRKLTDWCASFA